MQAYIYRKSQQRRHSIRPCCRTSCRDRADVCQPVYGIPGRYKRCKRQTSDTTVGDHYKHFRRTVRTTKALAASARKAEILRHQSEHSVSTSCLRHIYRSLIISQASVSQNVQHSSSKPKQRDVITCVDTKCKGKLPTLLTTRSSHTLPTSSPRHAPAYP